MSWIQRNWFVLGIFAAVLLGLLFPSLSVLNSSGIITTGIVIGLFLSIGFTLPVNALKSGLANIRLHLFMQFFIFILTPLYYFLITSVLDLPADLRIGILALAVLPTTVSTCIVFTQASGGNTVGTMFNAVLSNVGGVFLSPLLLSLLLQGAGRDIPASVLASIILSLCWKMLLPLIIGHLANRIYTRRWVVNKKKVGSFNNLLILFLVLFSIARSASDQAFIENLTKMGGGVLLIALSFYLLTALAYVLGKALKFSSEDMISILYAAPQKTLAMGVPLLSAYFADDPQLLGTVLIPLLFYHPWQIMNAGVVRMLSVMNRRGEDSLEGKRS